MASKKHRVGEIKENTKGTRKGVYTITEQIARTDFFSILLFFIR